MEMSPHPPRPTQTRLSLLLQMTPLLVHLSSAASAIKLAPYALNQSKQLTKLSHDTLLTNFEIVVSPSQENINIQCNSGFYSQVLRPCLQDIRKGTEFLVNDHGVIVECMDTTNKVDKSGTLVNNVFFLRLWTKTRSDLGPVTLHLHHTARKLQIQGSIIMPDKTTAPVWFVENVIKDRLNFHAHSKAFDVTNFNQTVHKLIENSRSMNNFKTCSGCHLRFGGRSLPELCTTCNLTFHKKCITSAGHSCSVSKRGQSCSAPLSSTSSQSLLHPYYQASFKNPAPATTTPGQRLYPPVLGPSPDPKTAQTSPQSSPGSPQLTPNDSNLPPGYPTPNILAPPPSSSLQSSQNTPPQLNPHALPFPVQHPHPAHASPTAAQNSTTSNLNTGHPAAGNFTQKGKKKTNKPLPPTDQLSFELEFKKIELNSAKTMIQELETTIKNLKQTNFVLEERVKLLESSKKKGIHDQYFPPTSHNHNVGSSESIPQPTRTACSCHIHSQSCSSCPCLPRASCPHVAPSPETNALIKKIEFLSIEIKEIKTKLSVLIPVSGNDEGDKPAKHSADATNTSRQPSNLSSGTSSPAPEPSNTSPDDSVNTIDEEVSDLELDNPLNCRVLTTQLA